MADEFISVEVAYATAGQQLVIEVNVPRGTRLNAAVAASGILERFPEIDLAVAKVGIYGKRVEPDTVLSAGDRVEIYRPLLIDPKEARRQRAGKGVSS